MRAEVWFSGMAICEGLGKSVDVLDGVCPGGWLYGRYTKGPQKVCRGCSYLVLGDMRPKDVIKGKLENWVYPSYGRLQRTLPDSTERTVG